MGQQGSRSTRSNKTLNKTSTCGRTRSNSQPSQSLPIELVAAIFSAVAELEDGGMDTLRALALVCYGWSHLCRRLIHQTVEVRDRGLSQRSMRSETFIRIYSEHGNRDLRSYVANLSLEIVSHPRTNGLPRCLLRFSNLHSLRLECHRDGNLDLFAVSLRHLLALPTFTSLSLSGYTYTSIIDTLLPILSDSARPTNLNSLYLQELKRMPAFAQNSKSVCMVGIHHLHVDDNGIIERLGIQTPSLRHFSTSYNGGALLPLHCPSNIRSLTIRLSQTPECTGATAPLRELAQLQNLTLVSRGTYEFHMPWFYECVRGLGVPKNLQRLEMQLWNLRTLRPFDHDEFDGLLSWMFHDGSLREVHVELTTFRSHVELVPTEESVDPLFPPNIKARIKASWPLLTRTGILSVSVKVVEYDEYRIVL